ncbi:MAG TPA: ABC transporter permease [Acidimicrobiales bacterium]|nr:ABC transporter permease [Acidimicrobiales bacterium]
MSDLGGVLAAEPFIRWDWVRDHTDDIRSNFWEHVQLTVLAVGIGFVIALAMALVAVRWRAAYGPLAAFCAALYAVPSVALFALLLPFVGLSMENALIALVTYTLLILLRNIVAGLDGVPPEVREAADGMGYERWRRVLRVDLPLATPSIVAGLRIATVTTIGLVTVTALVGEGGFGRFINEGLSRQFPTEIVLGSVLSVALAIACDVLFVLAERLLVPWARAKVPIEVGKPGRLTFARWSRHGRTVDA